MSDHLSVPARDTAFRREIRRAARAMVEARWPIFAMIFLLAASIAAAFGPLFV